MTAASLVMLLARKITAGEIILIIQLLFIIDILMYES